MANRGALYVKLTFGQSLNLADVLNDNNNTSLERIIVVCNTAGGVGGITINMPEVSALGAATNFNVLVQDIGGNAAVNNITINRAGLVDKINGANSTVINTNNGGCLLNVSSAESTGGSYIAVNTSSIAAGTETDANEFGQTTLANTFTTAFPILATRNLIIARGGSVLLVGTDYTFVAATGVITFLTGAGGDLVNVFYSHA